MVATANDVEQAIEKYSGMGTRSRRSASAGREARRARTTSPGPEVVEDAPIVKFVNLLVTQAVADRASDIHVEPTETDLRIRFRIDGVLHEVMRSPKRSRPG